MDASYQTAKQHELMRLVLEAIDRGEPATWKVLWKQLSYGSQWTKPEAARSALKCSMGFLKKWGYIVTEMRKEGGKGPAKVVYIPTALAYATFRR